MDVLQPSFSGGEISPELWHRNDIDFVKFGLKSSDNAIITPTGNWMMRPGTEYVYDSMSQSYKSILIPFDVSDTDRYMVEIMGGNNNTSMTGKIRILKSDGTLPVLNYASCDNWIPGANRPYEFVKIGAILYVQSNSVKFWIHTLYSQNLSVSNITVSTNNSDNLDVTYTNGVLDIKFANTTGSKNTMAYVIPAIALAVGSNASQWWYSEYSEWDASPPIGSFQYGAMNSRFVGRLDKSTNNWGSGWVISDGNYIVQNVDIDYTDLPLVRWCQNKNSLYIVCGNHKPIMLDFIDIDHWSIEFNLDINNGPFQEEFLCGEFNWNTDSKPSDSEEFYFLYDRATWSFGTPVVKTFYVYGYDTPANLVGLKLRVRQTIHAFEYSNSFTYQNGAPVQYKYIGFTSGIFNYELSGTYTIGANDYIKFEYSRDGSTWVEITGIKLTTGTVATYNLGFHAMIRLSCKITNNGYSFGYKYYAEGFDHYAYATVSSVGSTYAWEMNYTFDTNNWLYNKGVHGAFGDDYAYSDPVTEYYVSAGSFCNEFGWPQHVYFFQNRLGYAATRRQPNSRWESKIGQFNDFGISIPILANDAVYADLPADSNEQIKAVCVFHDLVILTQSGEWHVMPDSGGYGPLNIPVTRKEGNTGSFSTVPVVFNQDLIHVVDGGSFVRSLKFDYQASGYVGEDITLFGKHLFDGYTITRMAYQADPWSIVWLLRSDGNLISMTYLPKLRITAFAYHNFGGTVEDIAVLNGSNDALWMIVNRSGLRTVEKMHSRSFSSLSDAFFVDCGTKYSVSPTKTFTGLGRLDGKTISVLADGSKIVGASVSSGTLTLSNNASKVVVGLPYTAKFEPLHLVVDRQTGSGHAVPQKIGRAKIRVIKTVGGSAGPSNAGKQAISETALNTGWKEFRLSSNHSNEQDWDVSQFYYEQNSPLPAQISAIIMSIE
jgi:hypothetical protein